MRTHKVGTLTLGVTLVVMGILFLVQMFCSFITTAIIFRSWPIVFILLGVEILLANRKTTEQEFVYDKVGIFLTMGLLLFAMFLAILTSAAQYHLPL